MSFGKDPHIPSTKLAPEKVVHHIDRGGQSLTMSLKVMAAKKELSHSTHCSVMCRKLVPYSDKNTQPMWTNLTRADIV